MTTTRETHQTHQTCESCGARYPVTAATDLIAQAEFARLFPESDVSQAAKVCGKCFIDTTNWMWSMGLSGRITQDRPKLNRIFPEGQD